MRRHGLLRVGRRHQHGPRRIGQGTFTRNLEDCGTASEESHFVKVRSGHCGIKTATAIVFNAQAYLWSRGVARWFRWSLSVAGSFVCRCLTSRTLLPFPHPAHRTGRADLPHPALGEDSRNRLSHCL
jgi:hypothetical protein